MKSVESAKSIEEVARVADIMTVTVTTDASGSAGYPYIARTWIKPGALLFLPAAVRFDDELLISGEARLMVDSWCCCDAWRKNMESRHIRT